jgi:hypothetical protein
MGLHFPSVISEFGQGTCYQLVLYGCTEYSIDHSVNSVMNCITSGRVRAIYLYGKINLQPALGSRVGVIYCPPLARLTNWRLVRTRLVSVLEFNKVFNKFSHREFVLYSPRKQEIAG